MTFNIVNDLLTFGWSLPQVYFVFFIFLFSFSFYSFLLFVYLRFSGSKMSSFEFTVTFAKKCVFSTDSDTEFYTLQRDVLGSSFPPLFEPSPLLKKIIKNCPWLEESESKHSFLTGWLSQKYKNKTLHFLAVYHPSITKKIDKILKTLISKIAYKFIKIRSPYCAVNRLQASRWNQTRWFIFIDLIICFLWDMNFSCYLFLFWIILMGNLIQLVDRPTYFLIKRLQN